MRKDRMNGWNGDFRSSFLSCEKDTETIVRKLFVDSKPYSDDLKRLLVIPNRDCLDAKTNPKYMEKLREMTLGKMVESKYIRITPRLDFGENEEVKNYLLITYDNFVPNANDEYYRDHIVMIDIICNLDNWELGNYRIRPIKIAGYVDGILNGARLSGIGKLQFMGMNEIVLSENLAGYCLMYRAINGVDDKLEGDDIE